MCTLCYMFHLCMCIYTWCHSHPRGELHLSLIMSEAAVHTCAWIMFECVRTHRPTNTSIHTYMQLQAYVCICTFTVTHTHLPHTHTAVFKFYCASVPVSLTKPTISLYLSIVRSFSNTP